MASLVLLANDYLTLSKEAGRRNAEVREASERAHALLKTSNIAPTPLYAPIFLANSTRNAKVIALAVGCLSRLITAGIVPQVSST